MIQNSVKLKVLILAFSGQHEDHRSNIQPSAKNCYEIKIENEWFDAIIKIDYN